MQLSAEAVSAMSLSSSLTHSWKPLKDGDRTVSRQLPSQSDFFLYIQAEPILSQLPPVASCPPARHCCDSVIFWLCSCYLLVTLSAARALLARAHLTAHQDPQGLFHRAALQLFVPSLHHCKGLFLPKCRNLGLSLLSFTRPLPVYSSSLDRSQFSVNFSIYTSFSFRSTVPLPLVEWITCIKPKSL